MAQWVEDLALKLQHFGLQLPHGFDPWPGNFHRPWAQPKKKKRQLFDLEAELEMMVDLLV